MEYKEYKKLTPFKLCVLQNFPYIEENFDALTNYELMCKIVEYLNGVIKNEINVEENVDTLHENFIILKNYVDNYFNNLDVQEEIDNKLDAMALDGTLTNLIKNYINPLFNDINVKFGEINDNIDMLSTRMDSFTRLEEGSTTGDAELIDGRIGYNSVVYNNIGDAIRAQVTSLHDDLDILQNGKTTLKYYCLFEQASLSRGVINRSNKYRVCTDDIITLDREIKLYVNEGYKFGIQTFSVDGDFIRDSGWQTTEYTLAKNTRFKIVIAKVTEDTSVNANVDEFANQVWFYTINSDVVHKLQNINDILDFNYPKLIHQKAVRTNGGCINSNNIYMWIVASNKNIHWVNIITGEYGYVKNDVNGVTAENGGHCNDFCYNPNDNYYYMATMLEDGSISKLNSGYIYTESIIPIVNGNHIVTEGICYNRKTNEYILAGENDWYFYVFNNNWEYVRTIIPDDTPRTIKQGIETDGYYIYRILTNSERRAWIRTYDLTGHLVSEIEIPQFKGAELESLGYSWEIGCFISAMNIKINNVDYTQVYAILPSNNPVTALGYNNLQMILLSSKLK